MSSKGNNMSIFSRLFGSSEPTEQPHIMRGSSLQDFLSGKNPGMSQAEYDKAIARAEAGRKYNADMKVWLQYMKARIFCIQPNINDYYANPNYVWPRPNKPLPGPQPPRPV